MQSLADQGEHCHVDHPRDTEGDHAGQHHPAVAVAQVGELVAQTGAGWSEAAFEAEQRMLVMSTPPAVKAIHPPRLHKSPKLSPNQPAACRWNQVVWIPKRH